MEPTCHQHQRQTAPPVYPDKIDGAVLKIAGVVVLGAIMSILDITVVNVALPDLPDRVRSPGDPLLYSTVAWTVTAYTLALAIGHPAHRLGGRPVRHQAPLHDRAAAVHARLDAVRHGRPRSSMLIGFRVLQGLGGGMLMPLGMTIMTRAAGPARMGRLMAILGVPMLLGPIFGPILGGYLIDNYSLALDLPDQRADRRRRDHLLLASCWRPTAPPRRSPSTGSAWP